MVGRDRETNKLQFIRNIPLVRLAELSIARKMDRDRGNVDVEIKIYGYRWVQLFIFCLFTVINFMQFLEFTIVADILTKYYSVDSSLIDLSGLVFFAVYIILFLPISYLIERYSLKITAVVSTFLTLAGNVVKIFSTHPSRFYLVLVGQALCAVGQVYMISIPTKFASVWFGANEVSTACALAVLGTQLGSALGAIFPPFLVGDDDNEAVGLGLYNMTIIYVVPSAIVLITVLLFFKARPKLPPSRSQMHLLTQSDGPQESFFSMCKVLMKNKDYLIILFAFGLTNGIWNSFGIVVNTLYTHYFPNGQTDIGIISLIAIIAGGCAGNLMWGMMLDRTHQFKKISLGVLGFAIVTYVVMAASILLQHRVSTFITIPMFGFFAASTLVVSYEYALEVTYPIPESVSCSILNAVIFFFAIAATLVIEGLIGTLGYIAAHAFALLSFVFCFFCVTFVSSNLKRRAANVTITDKTRV
ncbi:unnamed protein product [Phyllotreta striolata]|uniref:Uncharacterized protein n=1 Tax=Phyllotreta striolata TaxID=444603 RepID=A0A9N9TV71_PHYSR|nr:unnamed protein product [Phyllotreta striolata]